MKTARTLVALVVAAFAACAFAAESPVREPAKVIFDTDMFTDYDDIGAIAVLHALADAGECEILATVSSTRGNSSVAVCEVVNAWYGRPASAVRRRPATATDTGSSGRSPRSTRGS